MIEHLGSRLRHRYMIVAGLFLAGSILGISLFVSGSLGSVQSAYALNHGVGLTKGCDDTTPEIGDTVGCNAQTVFIDQALDSSVILGAIDCILAPNQAGSPFASLNVNTLQLECLNSGNNPTPTAILPTSIEVVTGTNAICTQSNSQNVLPCLMGDALKTTASNGLTLPGTNLPGSIIFHYTSGFTYTIPGTYRDQAGISWKDLGDGIPGQGADTINTQQTPSPTVNSVVTPEDYTPSTLSSVTGSVKIGSASLVNPTDTLSIAGVNGVSGTFAISNAALTGPGGPYAATATPNPVGPTSTFPATTTLSLAAGTTISQAGTYCWDVTVTETGGNYVATPKVLTGSASPGTECFTVTVVTEQPWITGGGRVEPPKDTLVGVNINDGGGIKNTNRYILTHGFELHCDWQQVPNNLTFNFPHPKTGVSMTWKLERLDEALCVDTWDVSPIPPPQGPDEDTYYGEGKGRLFEAGKGPDKANPNQEGCGASAYWTFTDGNGPLNFDGTPSNGRGEPGKNDRIVDLHIEDKTGKVIVHWEGTLTGYDQNVYGDAGYFLRTGNHQMHIHQHDHTHPENLTPCNAGNLGAVYDEHPDRKSTRLNSSH